MRGTGRTGISEATVCLPSTLAWPRIAELFSHQSAVHVSLQESGFAATLKPVIRQGKPLYTPKTGPNCRPHWKERLEGCHTDLSYSRSTCPLGTNPAPELLSTGTLVAHPRGILKASQ